MKHSTKHILLAALCLAIAFILPTLTGMAINKVWSPMHIAIFICAYVTDRKLGALTGFIAPIARGLLFGMPPLFPTAIAMAFELATYGYICGLLNVKLPKSNKNIYVSLITAMIIGRIVWGLISWVLYTLMGNPFTWKIFIAGALLNAWPGIVLQIIVIPVLIMALRKAKVIDHGHSHN